MNDIKPEKKRMIRYAIGAAVLVLAATLTWREVWSTSSVDPKKQGLLTEPVTKGMIERTVIAAGIIQPVEFVDVGAQISGQLRTLNVTLGAKVKKGQLLGEIDPTLNQAKLTEAMATVENLEAQRKARLEQRALAQLQRSRNARLLAEDALAPSEAEVTEASYRVAVTAVTSLDAQIKQARAGVATAQANLGYARIVAPMDGEVVSITARAGQTLNANQTAPNILRIARLDTMTVWAQVPEADITNLRIGQEAYFTILGDPDTKRKSTVRQILPGPEIINGVVFYNALFDVPNPDKSLKVQMTAQVHIVQDRSTEALLVPLSALAADKQGRPDRHRAKVLLADGTTETRSLKTGIKNGQAAQVLSGVNEGELLVVGDSDTSGATKPSKPKGATPKIR